MTKIPFTKMVASGNDFVVIDNRLKIISDPVRFARKVCALHTGLGADGVLLLEKSSTVDFKMRIINSDGTEAEACGNGFRCIALFAHEKLGFPSTMKFESLSGRIEAIVKGETVRVELVEPTDYRERSAVEVLGQRLHYTFINTGVPHAVIFVEGLEKIEVEKIGRALRYHSRFSPKGTNVNFVEVKGPRKIHVRTYERGVENETLACGTGSTASAILSVLAGHVKTPVKVKTHGGEILTVDFKQQDDEICGVTLEGNVRFVAEGKLYPAA